MTSNSNAELVERAKRHASQLLDQYLYSAFLSPSKADIKAYAETFRALVKRVNELEAAEALSLVLLSEGEVEKVARIILGPKSHWNGRMQSESLSDWLQYPEVERALTKARAILSLVLGGRGLKSS